MSARTRDRGSVLPLVLVMIVVAGLIVIPLMDYAMSVFRANTVVSQRTKQLEASKGGLRVALADPRNVFLECDAGGTLPATTVNGVTVTTTCQELGEVGPNEALGFEVPTGIATMQLGAQVPQSFSGTRRQSPAVPPYPADGQEAWWIDQASDVATTDQIWIPQLPLYPSTTRTGGYPMPSSFGCTVYFPGRYATPLALTSGRHYFASGVYYFTEPVQISGTADVVVGYGLEEFSGSDCADDVQVAANVQADPGTFDINGGGATFVFGGNGRLSIADASGSGTGPRVRFNQRYADPDRGGRISIMSVNGDTTATYHSVTKVNRIPNSMVLTKQTDGSGVVTYVPQNIANGTYAPSSPTITATAPLGLTDKVHDPLGPSNIAVRWLRTLNTTGNVGAVIVSWDAVAGYNSSGRALAGGTMLHATTPYTATASRPSPAPMSSSCAADSIVFTPGSGPSSPPRASCLITGLGTANGINNNLYTVTLSTKNDRDLVGSSASAAGRPSTNTAPNSDVVVLPGPPTAVTVAPGAADGSARVRWTAPVPAAPNANKTPPVIRYEVQAYRVYLEVPATVREELVAGATCQSMASAQFATDLECTVPGLTDLVPGDGVTGNLGYRFAVTPITSAPGTPTPGYTAPLPTAPFTVGSLPLSFDGGGTSPLPTIDVKLAARIVEPWVPTAIVDIQANGSRVLDVQIAGYVAVPMGQVKIGNPNHDPIKINGGIMAGTFNVDPWMRTDPAETTPIGFKNDIVLQRKVRITSRGGNATSTAIVEVNEDGAGYAVNSWVIQ